ncbi:MAG: tryptophan 7-halogenase [Phycisphaeraceae bacterium]|nr:tryptophan 7-halogenase [Phycisphaeraceae bacterium]
MVGHSAEPAIFDVAVVGGGPAGSTVSTLLKKYQPTLRVAVFEGARFPRPHIGESQLPATMPVIFEMGCWDKVEAAGFPIKIGASYTWGRDDETWEINFFPPEDFKDQPRPAPYEGQRKYTAFQVERGLYDKILLDHAQGLGVEVFEESPIEEVLREGDRVTGLRRPGGEIVTARYYIDASGARGFLRRAMGIESHAPKELRNIAIYNYWDNAKWAIEIGVGGTRIQIRSLPYGWIWFIPLGPTVTSIGLVCPADYYKKSGKTAEQLYLDSIASQPLIADLVSGAHVTGPTQTTKDWSHLCQRLAGDNWFLIGEAAGFADPILSAGMSLAHHSGRHAAYTILELERGELDAGWLKRLYDERNRQGIEQHIRFAHFWYASNGCFTELKEYCGNIAKDAGLKLDPRQAWEWLALGGFTSQYVGLAQAAHWDLFGAKKMVDMFLGFREFRFQVYNQFRLDLKDAKKDRIGALREGRVLPVECFRRGRHLLPNSGHFGLLIHVLKQTRDGVKLVDALRKEIAKRHQPEHCNQVLNRHLEALEAMIQEGWVDARLDKSRPMIQPTYENESKMFRSTADDERALMEAKRQREGMASSMLLSGQELE